jgi:hypothetical protein
MIKGGVMKSGLEMETRQELMPGLDRYSNNTMTRITFRWFHGIGSLANKIFEILVFIFASIVASVTYNSVSRVFSGGANFSQLLIDGFFFIAGLILVYRGILLMANRSTFEILDNNFSVHHGPLPGAGNFILPVNEIAGVEWQKAGQSSRAAYTGNRLGSGYSAVFNVILTTTSGRKITLVSGIHAREYAFALSSEISNLLK